MSFGYLQIRFLSTIEIKANSICVESVVTITNNFVLMVLYWVSGGSEVVLLPCTVNEGLLCRVFPVESPGKCHSLVPSLLMVFFVLLAVQHAYSLSVEGGVVQKMLCIYRSH